MAGGVYRSRLKRPPSKEASRFLSSIGDDYRIFEEDIDGTEAHNIMLFEQGILSKEDLTKILSSLEKLRREYRSGKVKMDYSYEDVHEYIESYVTRDVGVEVGGKLHTGRSRNDQVVLDIRMRLRTEILEIAEAVIDLISALLERAREFKGKIMPLYTHTQHAQIGTLSHYLLSYVDVFLRDLNRLDSCYERVNLSPLGAGPIGGTSIPVDRWRTASLLGFKGIIENSIDAVSSRDVEIEVLSVLANLMTSISRIAEDLVLWSSSEFRFIEVADEYSSTSSIMPQKKNPCTLELLRGRTGRVYGALAGVLSICKGLVTGYNRDLQEVKHHLWVGLESVKDSVEILAGAIKTLSINEDRMRAEAELGYTLAVDLAERLVEEVGLPFREAHRLVGKIVSELISRNLKLSDLKPELIEEVSLNVLGKRVKIPDRLLSEVLNPEASLYNRKSVGSPNPVETDRMLRDRSNLLEKVRARWLSRKESLEDAKILLMETVKKYITEI